MACVENTDVLRVPIRYFFYLFINQVNVSPKIYTYCILQSHFFSKLKGLYAIAVCKQLLFFFYGVVRLEDVPSFKLCLTKHHCMGNPITS